MENVEYLGTYKTLACFVCAETKEVFKIVKNTNSNINYLHKLPAGETNGYIRIATGVKEIIKKIDELKHTGYTFINTFECDL